MLEKGGGPERKLASRYERSWLTIYVVYDKLSIGKQYNMKKNHKVFDEYNMDLEIKDSSPLYGIWKNGWLNYLQNLNGLSENQSLRNIKFNIIEHYTDDGVTKGDFDPSSSKSIGNYQNYKVINLFNEDHKHLFLEFMNLNLNVSSIESFINKFGTLGSPVVQKRYSEQVEDYKNESIIQGELLQCWYVEIKNLKSLLKNYQYYLERDLWKLNEKFKVMKKGETNYWIFKETENIDEEFPLTISFTSKNYRYPIKLDNEDTGINSNNIDQIISEYIIEVIKKFYSERTRAYIDANNYWFNTKFEPKGLIGFIWHGAIKLIEEKNEIKNCKYCSKEFVIGQYNARKNKLFCTRSHAVLSKRKDNFLNSICKMFKKKGFEINLQQYEDSLFDFSVSKKNSIITGISTSFSESLDSKSKKWNFLIQKKIKEPMLSLGLSSAYLINKNLDCFLFTRNNNNFKKLKSPLEYDSLIKFIKNNEKQTKNK